MDSELLEAVKYDGGPVDIEVVMEQIRDYLAKKHGGTRVRPPTETSASRIFGQEIYDELFQANQVYDKTYVAPYLTPAKLPVLGGFWQRVRGQFHGLVVFYVNRAAETQARFNTSVVRVLNGIVSGIDADQTSERVERLEKRVAELEKQLKALSSGQISAGKQENA